jgi:plastocyanin
MKANLYYGVFLVAALLVFVVSGPASLASPTDATQLTETTDEIEELPERFVTVAVAKGSNGTFQNYTYTPESVEINAGESVTWFSPVDPDLPVDIHTVTFFGNLSILDDMTAILPFAIPGAATDFDPIPPFEVGEPLITETPDGRQAIMAANKNAFYPAVIDGNSQTTYLNETDIQYTLNGTEMALNSGIILPQLLPPLGGAEANDTEAGTAGGELSSETSPTNETTTMTNATTSTSTSSDTTTVPEDQGTSAATEGEEQLAGAPFPIVSSFTVTFEQPGIYPYLCAIHPWMSGQVVVSGDIQTEEAQAQNQTEEAQAQNQTEEAQAQNQTEALSESGSVNPIFG